MDFEKWATQTISDLVDEVLDLRERVKKLEGKQNEE